MGVHRRIVVAEGGVLVCALATAALLSSEAQWDPLWLVLALLALHVATETVSMSLGTGRISANAVPLALTPVLAGPGPAAVTTVIALLVDTLRSRPPAHAAMTNLGGNVAAAVAGGAILQAYDAAGIGARGTLAFGAVVLLASLVVFLVSSANLLVAMSATGVSSRDILRTTLVAVVPAEAAAMFVVAATALLYAAYGGAVLAGVPLFLAALGLMLRSVSAAERRAREIDRLLRHALEAEERERRRVAAQLHDDALQTLLSARADLVEGLSGDPRALSSAHDSVAETVAKLRRLMSGLRGPEADTTPLGDALEDLAIDVERRTGATASVEVDPDLGRRHDGLLVAVARELLVNVVKHARASSVLVRLAHAPGGGVALEVADDGIGIADVNREALRHDGHLGLTLLEERVGSRGGTCTFTPRDGGGTRALVHLPG